MLNNIIKFSLRNRLAILVAAILICVGGIYTSMHMEVDVFPDLNAPTVVVMTEARGMAPEEVERIVTFPIETAMNGATNVRRVRSSSTTGFSCVWVEFDWGTDIYRDRQIVNEKLAEVGSTLPSTVGQPTLGPQSSILGEVMIIGLTCGEGQDLRTLADWTIRPRLLSIGGVAQVSVQGGEEKEYQVTLHPERMKYHGVSVDEAVEAVRDMNQNVSGGVLYEYGNEYLIRGALATNDVDALGQTVVKVVDGSPVTLNEFADIKVGNKTPKVGTASNNAKPAVLLTVAKQPNVSTEELTERLDAALADIKHQLPEGVNVDAEIFRQERFIDASISNIKESLIEGAIFVIIVLFLFLMNPRTTLISLVSIPVSLLVGILVLKFMGLTINTMSIGGMAIAIGSLVDDAIVDVENVHRKTLSPSLPRNGEDAYGLSRWLGLIYEASREVRMPILNSTLIVVVCFLPLFFLSGMEGRMLAPLGIAFIVSLFASTIVALTLTPVLCSYFMKGKARRSSLDVSQDEGAAISNVSGEEVAATTVLDECAAAATVSGEDAGESADVGWVAALKRGYASLLRRALRHRKPILGAVFVLVVAAVVMFVSMGRSFLPSFNEGSYTISISSLPGISLEESDKIGRRAEQLLMSIPEIKTVARKTGRAELDEHAFGVNTSEIEAPFELKDRSRAELLADVRRKLSTLKGVSIEIGQPISHRIDAMLSGTQANIAIKLFGQDLNRMYRIANQIKSEIADVEGVADLNVEQQVERPQIRITPRRHLMARYGVTPKQFADYVSVLLEGETVSQVYEGNQAFDLTVKVHDEDRGGIEDIRSLMIDANGQKIPLEYIADISSTTGPNTINRENAQRKLVISCNVEGRDLRSVVNDIQHRINADVKLPEGYHLEYGGQFESEESATRTLLLVSLLSVLVIFLLLNNQFRSIKQSAIVLVNLPLALIGGVFALQITGGVLSIPAIIGFISLFGIATRNGILLIDRYNTLSSDLPHPSLKGMDEVVIRGSLDRMTPILMTALTSALALVPLAIGGDLAGNEIQSPMAKVMLGGLISSTLLNMFIVPLMYKKRV